MLRQFLDPYIAEAYGAMVALQKDRAGLVYFIINLAAGGFVALDIVVNFYAVEGEGDFVSDDGGFSRLPLVTWFGDEFVGCFEIIDGAIAVDRVNATSVVAGFAHNRIKNTIILAIPSRSLASVLSDFGM